jgi:hypothetical protein
MPGVEKALEEARKDLQAAAPAIEAAAAKRERERLLSDEAVQAAAEKADEPYEWARESPQEFIKKVLEAALAQEASDA